MVCPSLVSYKKAYKPRDYSGSRVVDVWPWPGRVRVAQIYLRVRTTEWLAIRNLDGVNAILISFWSFYGERGIRLETKVCIRNREGNAPIMKVANFD